MRVLPVLLLLLTGACSSTTTGAPDSGMPDLDATGGAIDGSAPGGETSDGGVPIGGRPAVGDLGFNAVTVAGHVIFDKLNNRPNIPARGRVVGFTDGSASATTDDAGAYSLSVGAGPTRLLRAQLDGELSVQRLLDLTSPTLAVELHVMDIDAYAGALAQLQTGPDQTTHGVVAVRFPDTQVGGYTARISSDHGGAWVYGGNFDATALPTATTQKGGDTVYFYEVTPGSTTVTVEPPPGHAACVDAFAPSATRYQVDVFTLTEIVVRCP